MRFTLAVAAVASVFGLTSAAATGPNASHLARHADIAAKQHVSRGCTRFPSSIDTRMRDILYKTTLKRTKSHRIMVTVMATGLTESYLNNLNCGDRQSHGVFQQQSDNHGGFTWGTVAQTMDPTHACNAFLDCAIPEGNKHPDWPANILAQHCQQAQAGDQYYRHLNLAESVIADAKKKYDDENEEIQSSIAASKSKAASISSAKSKSRAASISSVKSVEASISEAAASSSAAAAAAAASEAAEEQGAQNVAGAPKTSGADGPAPTDGANSGAQGRIVFSGLALLAGVWVALL